MGKHLELKYFILADKNFVRKCGRISSFKQFANTQILCSIEPKNI